MVSIQNHVYTVLLLAAVPISLGLSINIAEYIIQGTNKQWTINQGSFTVRSLLQCSTKCSEINNICGFNYLRSFDSHGSTVRSCQCLLLPDLNPLGSHDNITHSLIYIHVLCKDIYKNLLMSTTSTTTVTSTTTTTSTVTTTLSPCSSIVDALVFISGTIYLFIDDQIFTYSSHNELTTGASTTATLSSSFPEVSYPLDAGYSDGTFVYMIKGTDTWKYSSDQFVYHSHVTTSTLYTTGDDDQSDSSSDSEDGDSALNSSYDAILQSGTQTYLFMGNSMTIVESGSAVKTVSISNNGNNNPYKSNNFSNRPSQIVAACSIDSDTHVFLSHNSVYTFTFSTQLWNNLGHLVCS